MMAGEDDNNETPPPEDKTVFAPSPFTQVPTQAPSPFDDAPQEKTVPPVAPKPAKAAAQPAQPAPPPEPAAPQPAPATAFTPMAPRADGGSIQIGDVLNHMFEVKRFIARGGMGEVFEGVNVASDERVAIKVMLPSLAADPNVQAMFRKEAKTLTKLAHPALVQYRVMATEPQLGVLYIVTEYIDSKNLEDALPIKATPKELLALTRRLADGLRVAHALGAIHRDISPDNVLLENGELLKARIIDFGIAKDTDPGSKTIIGDGFAGKFNFVAPEQLGDFDRTIGPWTDIYSLALVILAVANGKPVNMSGSHVDAIDKRRQGVDVSGAPAELQPLLTAMLKPNPLERLRSMDEVIAMIDGVAGPGAAPTKSESAIQSRPTTTGKSSGSVGGKPPQLDSKMLIIGGGAAGGLLLLVIAGVLVFGGKHPAKTTGEGQNSQSQAAQGTAVEPLAVSAARETVTAALPSVDCAWLDIADVKPDNGGVDVSLKGVAVDTIAVQKTVGDAMALRSLTLNGLNTDDVAPMQRSSACTLINAYAAIRAPGAPTLTSPQLQPEMDVRDDVSDPTLKGKKVARVVVNFYVDPQTPAVALYGIDPTGETGALLTLDRSQLANTAYLKTMSITAEPGGNYRLQFNQPVAGWSGLMMMSGKGPFPAEVVTPSPANRGQAWLTSFKQAATANGWHTQMLWIKAVDETPN